MKLYGAIDLHSSNSVLVVIDEEQRFGVAVALLVIVTTSYRQVCHAYPSGGGAYAVARANLGVPVALLAAAALLLATARSRPGLGSGLGRLYYFAVLNVALALGVAAGLLGHSRPFWTRTARS